MNRPTVGFAGMTHLGLVSATAIAAKGFPTICYDPDRTLIAALERGALPVVEPGLPELLSNQWIEPALLASARGTVDLRHRLHRDRRTD